MPSPTFPQINSPPQTYAEKIVNAALVALQHVATYAQDVNNTSALTLGYLGGEWSGFPIAAGTVTLTASTTNYVVVAFATGVLSASTATANWNNTAAYARVYKIVTGSGSISSIEDFRGGPGGVFGSAAAASAYVPGEGVNPQTGTSYTFLATDLDKLVTFSNASAIAAALPQAGSTGFAATWFVDVENRGAGTLTITPATSTIDGLSSFALTTGQGLRLISDGTNYFTERGVGGAATFTGGTMTSAVNEAPPVSIALAGTMNIGAAAANTINVTTGTGPITAFDTIAAGALRCLIFGVACTWTYNATSMILPGLASINVLAGDVAFVESKGSGNWVCVGYQPAHGASIGSGGVNAQTGTSYALLTSDRQKLVTLSNASAVAVSIAQAGSAGFDKNWFTFVQNLGAGTVTITPATSTINAAATFALTTGQGAIVFSDGTNYAVFKGFGTGSGGGGSVFVASGTGHASGLVPDPGATVGTTRFLREDATFVVPAGGSYVSGMSLGPHAFSVYAAATTALSSGFTKVTFGTKLFDTDSAFDAVTNNRFTPTVAGYYQLTCGLTLTGASGNQEISFYKNGSSYVEEGYNSLAGTVRPIATALMYFNGTTDYAEIFGYSSGSATVAVGVSTFFCGALVNAGAQVVAQGSGILTRQYFGTGSGDLSTTSTSFVALSGYTVSIPASVGDVLDIFLSSVYYGGASGQIITFQFTANSADIGQEILYCTGSTIVLGLALRIRRVVVAGDIVNGLVTIAVNWKTSTGTAEFGNTAPYQNSLILENKGAGNGGLSQGTPHAFSAYAAATQSISAATFTKVTLGATAFDTDTVFDATTNYRFQPKIAGYYLLAGIVDLVPTSGEFASAIYKNGSIAGFGNDTGTSVASIGNRSTVNLLVYLNGSTDYIELWCYAANGGTVQSGATNTVLSGILQAASTGGGVPINSQSAAYTTTAADANGMVSHPSADTTARTFTIDNTVNNQVGTFVTFDNEYGAGTITIAISGTGAVLEMVGSSGLTGSRTLGGGGQATAVRKSATKWRISGIALS